MRRRRGSRPILRGRGDNKAFTAFSERKCNEEEEEEGEEDGTEVEK